MSNRMATPAPSPEADRLSPGALFSAVGRTPLVEIQLPSGVGRQTRVFAKLESANPGGSLKDRSVQRMIRGALHRGDLAGGKSLLDSSSGNAGIAYAQFGAALGIRTTLVVPANASTERLDRIRSYGADLILTDPLEGYDHAIREARRLALQSPGCYWYCDQYSNEDNWRAHYSSTAGEMLEQFVAMTGSPPDAFVAGVGTGGSLTGVGRRLRENSKVHITSVIPEPFPGIEGLKPLGCDWDMVPDILDLSLIDRRREVTSEDAVARCRWLARQGLFVGPSSGAYVEAAIELAEAGGFRRIATILNDTGERYGSTGMWSS